MNWSVLILILESRDGCKMDDNKKLNERVLKLIEEFQEVVEESMLREIRALKVDDEMVTKIICKAIQDVVTPLEDKFKECTEGISGMKDKIIEIHTQIINLA